MDLRKKVMYTISTGLLAGTLSLAPMGASSVAEAGGWDIVGSILGTVSQATAESEAVRYEILRWSNSPKNQQSTLDSSISKNGIDTDVEHNERVSRVLNQLIDRGNYAMEPNSLPFRWRVINSDEWNAGCYPTDYIEVNSALVKDLTSDDALAGVLAHEMIHGLHQHMANDAAQQVLYQYGAGLLTMNADYIQATLSNYLTNYVTIKNTSNISEADADESGFYLLASAGFNPGGFPIETCRMAQMDKSNRGILTEIFTGVYDHPASQKRFNQAEQRMEEYGYNHVKVKNGNEVYIDGQYLMTATEGNGLEDWENAYLIAGGISKGIHDYHSAYAWNFGSKDFLNDRAYDTLRDALSNAELAAKFQTMLENAYSLDVTDKEHRNTKVKLKQAEKERNDKIAAHKAEVMAPENAGAYRAHCDSYLDMELNKLAFKEAEKALTADPNSYIQNGNMARAYSALNDDYKEKHDSFNDEYSRKAIEFNEKALNIANSNSINDTYWLYTNMALYQQQAGNYTLSNEAALTAIAMQPDKEKNYRRIGYNSLKLGDREGAIKYYKMCLAHGGNLSSVPEEIVAEVQANSTTIDDIISDNE
ncbi:M48 family metalloprotease [Anaerovibrio sp. JC8]|uniref:M48 family metalloprotease n=1 Tax=Anaerovibrio sp. JC8 TaxID=1240085 RepID=UPI0013020368|nr:M48 family metalloprotease [Anaerovibrio sp. JC8]